MNSIPSNVRAVSIDEVVAEARRQEAFQLPRRHYRETQTQAAALLHAAQTTRIIARQGAKEGGYFFAEVPIDWIRIDEAHIDPDRRARLAEIGGSRDPAFAVGFDTSDLPRLNLLNGNNRAADAAERGQTHIPVYVTRRTWNWVFAERMSPMTTRRNPPRRPVAPRGPLTLSEMAAERGPLTAVLGVPSGYDTVKMVVRVLPPSQDNVLEFETFEHEVSFALENRFRITMLADGTVTAFDRDPYHGSFALIGSAQYNMSSGVFTTPYMSGPVRRAQTLTWDMLAAILRRVVPWCPPTKTSSALANKVKLAMGRIGRILRIEYPWTDRGFRIGVSPADRGGSNVDLRYELMSARDSETHYASKLASEGRHAESLMARTLSDALESAIIAVNALGNKDDDTAKMSLASLDRFASRVEDAQYADFVAKFKADGER